MPLSSKMRKLASAASPWRRGLVAYWKLEEASDTRYDSVGANHLSDINTVTQAAGRIGNAAQFTSANSEYLSVADNPVLSMGDIDFTIALWFYADTLPASYMALAAKWPNVGLQWEYGLWISGISGTSRLEWYVSPNGSTGTDFVQHATALSTATWYFVTVSHDAANNLLGISLNGGAETTQAYSNGVFDGTTAFTLGSRDGGKEYFNGRIDGVLVWKNRLLTSAERTTLYQLGLAGSPVPL